MSRLLRDGRILLQALVWGALAGCAAQVAPQTASVPQIGPVPETAPAIVGVIATGDLAPAALSAIPAYQGPLPDFAQKDPQTADVYRWAATHRLALQYFQCTSGCDRTSGHKSNYNCYVREEKPGGEYVWDPMSAG